MSGSMKDYSEKRDFHRMTVNSEIEITDNNGNTIPGICRDLSAAGMQLYAEKPFAEGDELHTLLSSTSEQFPPFEAICRVIRCEPDGDGYLMGTVIEEVKR